MDRNFNRPWQSPSFFHKLYIIPFIIWSMSVPELASYKHGYELFKPCYFPRILFSISKMYVWLSLLALQCSPSSECYIWITGIVNCSNLLLLILIYISYFLPTGWKGICLSLTLNCFCSCCKVIRYWCKYFNEMNFFKVFSRLVAQIVYKALKQMVGYDFPV
jgi:hypothetical protein